MKSITNHGMSTSYGLSILFEDKIDSRYSPSLKSFSKDVKVLKKKVKYKLRISSFRQELKSRICSSDKSHCYIRMFGFLSLVTLLLLMTY